jgi:hypothetical protein
VGVAIVERLILRVFTNRNPRGQRPDAFPDLFETVWEVGEKRAWREPGRLIATPLTSPLPAKRRGEGAQTVVPFAGADEMALRAPS